MTNQSEPFGRLLRGATNSIAAYEGKSAAAADEELGAAIGISWAAIQRHRARLLPRQPQAMERALARHDDLLRQAIDAYGGHVVKTVGDAFQAVFTTAPAALEAALAAQRALATEPWGPIDPILVRMALHVGIVQQRD